jgi:hypothetical protein
MKRYLYIGEATVETTGEAGMFPLDSFLGMTPASAASTTMHFLGRKGSATDDVITVTHTGHTTKAFMTEIVKYLQGDQKNPFFLILWMQKILSSPMGILTVLFHLKQLNIFQVILKF